MQNLEAMRDEIKAAAQHCDGTPTAKLVAVLVAAGITDTKELADVIGVKIRAVQAARKPLAKRTTVRAPGCAASQCAHQDAQTQQDAPENAPQCAETHHNALSPPRVHARIETPSGLLTHEDRFLDSPPSGPPKAKATPKTERGKRLALDWQLPDQWRKWTRINFAHASDAQIDTEAEKFRDFWHAKAGQGATKLDWQATWRNWCRTAFAPRASAYPINAGRASWDEQRAKRQADTRALMERMGLTSGAMQ